MDDRPAPFRFVVIGGGITGLSSAHRLLELGDDQGIEIDLTMLEAADQPGGVIRTVHRDGFLADAGPDNFVTNKPWGIALCKRLGIDDQLQNTTNAHQGALVARRERLVPIPEGFALMAPSRITTIALSPLFSWRGKLRMAMEPLIPARANNDDESLASFVTRRLGRETLDRLVQPLVGGIYCADPQDLSVRATLPRFLDMETRHGSLIRAIRYEARRNSTPPEVVRYSLFVAFKNGMKTLPNALAQKIGRDRIRLNTPVERVERKTATEDSGRRWSIRLKDGHTLTADGVVITCPTYRAAAMVRELDSVLARGLGAVEYVSTAVVNFAFRREQIAHPLDAFGFVVPRVERRHIMACSFTSVKYEGRAPEGYVLLRTFLGGALQQEVLDRDDEYLIDVSRQDLDALLGVRGEAVFATLHRFHKTMAQYKVGHLRDVAAMRKRLAEHKGLEIAGNGFEGVGIPDCVHDGEGAAERCLATVREIGADQSGQSVDRI